MTVSLGKVDSRPVRRVTAFKDRDRSIIIELEANGSWVRLKEKGRRAWFRCTVGQVWSIALKNAMLEYSRRKAEERETRRVLRRGGRS